MAADRHGPNSHAPSSLTVRLSGASYSSLEISQSLVALGSCPAKVSATNPLRWQVRETSEEVKGRMHVFERLSGLVGLDLSTEARSQRDVGRFGPSPTLGFRTPNLGVLDPG